MKNIEIAKRIVNASKNNSLTFFVGAGVSKCSGVPLWGELIEKICKEMKMEVSNNLSIDDYLRIPQMFRYTCNDSKKYDNFIKKIIDTPNAVPNEVHRLMLKLHPASFLTTNFDHLLENAVVEYAQSYKCVVEDEEVASINGDRFILKVHGDIEHNNYILAEEDYLAYEDRFKLISTLMRSVFSTNTVVFIGYGIGDYNVKLILDGVRRVLKEKFKPIFIRVDEEPLCDEEQKYYESKGLNVIEYSEVITPEEQAAINKDDYQARYVAVLNYIISITKEKLIGKNDDESFINLYNCLRPLDKLSALRISDIQNRISECGRISNTGVVYLNEDMEGLFKKFISIHEIICSEKNNIAEGEKKKYRLVRRVLNKGQVYRIRYEHKMINIYDKNISFADDKCINFDYYGMLSYCKNDYKEISAKLKKAFYLTRLQRYEEAFDEFLKIAKESFKRKDYVHFYLAEINCITLKNIFQSPIIRFNKNEMLCEKEEKLILWDTENEIFDSLPQEFKKEFNSLRELCTKESLYQYGFEASVDAMKLEKSLNTHTIEVGETSSLRVISRVNEYLHFLLGNGVCLDVFSEYKESVCTLMEKLIRKYADQQQKTLRESGLFDIAEDKIHFDQYDFYCFVKFFKYSSLEKVLKENNCENIEFDNINCIELAIHNLISYTGKMIIESKNIFYLSDLIGELATCLILTRYMNLSEKIIEEICQFIFKHNLMDITIDQKILFLNSQVFSRKITNPNIKKTIEDTLINFIDQRLTANDEGKKWEIISKTIGINYPNLAYYLDIDKKGFISRRLSNRVSIIIDKKLISMQKECVEYYFNLISKKQRRRLSKWIEDMLTENFEFERFALLMQINTRKAKKHSDNLFLYLNKIDWKAKQEQQNILKIYPKVDLHDELLNVGYWCMCGFLDSKKFMQFKGIDLEYDFMIDTMHFDYSKFNVAWLLKMNGFALNILVKKTTLRNKLLQIVIQEIRKNEIKKDERERLIGILGDNFAY